MSISAGGALQPHIQEIGSVQGASAREQEEWEATRPESRLDRSTWPHQDLWSLVGMECARILQAPSVLTLGSLSKLCQGGAAHNEVLLLYKGT